MAEMTDFQKQTVFKSDSEWVYRIPALFYERESETLLAFAEQRETTDDTSTKMLVMKTGKLRKAEESSKVAIEWSTLSTVEKAHIDGHRPMNPCPVYEKNSKTLFLFFICVEGTVSESWQIQNFDNKARLCYITSTDLGQSWSNVTDLTDTLGEIKMWATFAVGPGHGLQMRSGTLIVPTYAYVSCCSSNCLCFKCKKTPHALPLYSEDSGKTWKMGKMLNNESLECEMAEFFDDKDNSFIYCNARRRGSYREEAISESYTNDISKLCSTKKLVETGGGCQGSVVSFPAHSGDDPSQKPNKLLFTHPSHKSQRLHFGVYLNEYPKDPNAWSKPWIINEGPSGYSDLAYTDHDWFVCLMECGEQKETEQIASVVFNYTQVKQGIGA